MAQDKIIEISDGEMMFVDDMRNIISTAKEHTYKTANLMIVVSNWLVGRRIVLQEQNGKDRAEYGKRIISIASQELTRSFGKGYGETTLRNYRKFYLQFCDMQIQQPLLAEFKKGKMFCSIIRLFQIHCIKALLHLIRVILSLQTMMIWLSKN